MFQSSDDTRSWASFAEASIAVNTSVNQAHERVQALADMSRSRYVFIATQRLHWLQIRPIVHN